jgi:hypothetical protein
VARLLGDALHGREPERFGVGLEPVVPAIVGRAQRLRRAPEQGRELLDREPQMARAQLAGLGRIVLAARLDRRAHRALMLVRAPRVRDAAAQRGEPRVLGQVVEAVQLRPPHPALPRVGERLRQPGTLPPRRRRRKVDEGDVGDREQRGHQTLVVGVGDDGVGLPHRREPIAAAELEQRVDEIADVRCALEGGPAVASTGVGAERGRIGEHAERLLVRGPRAEAPVIALEYDRLLSSPIEVHASPRPSDGRGTIAQRVSATGYS